MNKITFRYHKRSGRWPALSALIAILALFAQAAIADRIHFTDGDSISGSLVSIEDGKVKWLSGTVGEVLIEQHHVSRIETGAHYDLKTSGRELNNCWMFIQRDQQHLHCDQGVQVLSSWKLVVAAGETLTEPLPLLTQKGNLKIAIEDSSGNNNITKYDVEARSELRFVESRHTIALRYQEESAESQTTRNKWNTSYQYDQFFTEQWFATGNAFYEEDEFREIDQRATAGLGMGYQFLETTYYDLLAKTTFNYVNQQFTNGIDRSNPAILWNLDFAWRFNDKGMELFHRHALLQSFNQSDDFEVSTLTGFRYPINGHFSSVIQLEYDYDNLPAEDQVDKKDQKWSIGVNYEW
jgi:putative salt-induced outer membrane protein YdiY